MSISPSLTDVVRNRLDAGSTLNVRLVAKETPGWADVIGQTVSGIFFDLALAAFLMLGFGAAHTTWAEVPAPGYWTCFLLILGVSAVGISWRGTKRVLST